MIEAATYAVWPIFCFSTTPGDFIVELCRYGREQGLEWWTSEQIWHWFRKRRQVRVESDEKEIRISTNEVIHGLTLMLPQLANETLTVTNENTKIVRSISLKERFGLPYLEMILDLPAGMTNLKLALRGERGSA